MTTFAPYGASTTIEVAQSSQAVPLPSMPAGTPALSLVSRQSSIGVLHVRLGDGTVTVTEDSGMRVFAGTPEHPTILGVSSGETHIAILCVGSPGKVTLTAGSLLTGDTTTVIADNAVTDAKLADMAGYSLKGRNAGTSGDPSDIDISALTEKTSPAADDLFLIQDSAAANAFKKVKSSNVGGGATSVTAAGTFATDNRLLRSDGTGRGAQASAIACDDSGNFSGIGTLASGAQVVSAAVAAALAVGANGFTDPVLRIDASAASVATGIAIAGAAAGARVGLAAISSGTNEGLSIDAKGTGTIRLGAISTGAVEFSRNAVPTTSDGAALGTTALMWSDLFLASGAVINFNNGDVTVTHSADALAFAGASTKYGFDNYLEANLNSGALDAPLAGTVLHVCAADAAFTRIMIDSFGQSGGFTTRRASGTNAARTGILSGEQLFSFACTGYHSGGAYGTSGRAHMQMFSAENWTSTAQGAYVLFNATPAGGTSTAEQARFAGGAIYFPGAGTTASAANAFLNSGSSPANQLLRSTSSLRYKRNIEPIYQDRADAVLSLKPIWYQSSITTDRQDWSWYGLAAEEVAAVDPRLVHWGYREEDLDAVEVGEGDDKHIKRHPKAGAAPVPDGVMYERLSVLLIDVVKRQEERIKVLESRMIVR